MLQPGPKLLTERSVSAHFDLALVLAVLAGFVVRIHPIESAMGLLHFDVLDPQTRLI